MMPSMPPDGFADEVSGPPDGFADEPHGPNASQVLINSVSQGASLSPLGMVTQGADAITSGVGKIFDATGLRVPSSVSQVAKRLFAPARALGIGAVESMARTAPADITRDTIDAMNPYYQPKNILQKVGSTIGENAPVVAAGILSPAIGGPVAMMAQQAQTGKVSPVPLLAPAYSAAKPALEWAQKKMVPPFLKGTKGIPIQASKMALEDPAVLDRPGTNESVQAGSQDIINNVKEASRKVGGDYRNAYAEAGMKSPVDAIINDNPKAVYQKGFADLKEDYHAAMRGDLLKKQNLGGGLDDLSPQERLETLTDLKRSLQNKAIYPPAGQQLSPSEGAHNAAIQKMANDIDELRGKLPGGEQLAVADDAYSEIQELKQRLMTAFKDPYTGQDYLNRILKGNMDWLTSGRNAGKMGAIQRIEQITGKDVLKPALKEMAAAYLNNPDLVGLPSTRIEAFLQSLLPTKAFLKRPPTITPLFSGAASVAPAIGNQSAAAREDNGQEPAEKSNGNRKQKDRQNDPTSNLQDNHGSGSIPEAMSLTKEKAREFLDKAHGNRELARKLARKAGFTWTSSTK